MRVPIGAHPKVLTHFLAQKHLMVPSNKVIGEIGLLFSRMSKTYCAISKLEYLLEAVRLIYEHVCSPSALRCCNVMLLCAGARHQTP